MEYTILENVITQLNTCQELHAAMMLVLGVFIAMVIYLLFYAIELQKELKLRKKFMVENKTEQEFQEWSSSKDR